jgi:hypothetical protein
MEALITKLGEIRGSSLGLRPGLGPCNGSDKMIHFVAQRVNERGELILRLGSLDRAIGRGIVIPLSQWTQTLR